MEERVLALVRNYGRRKDMEAEVRGGKLSRWADYAVRAQALEAIGLSV